MRPAGLLAQSKRLLAFCATRAHGPGPHVPLVCQDPQALFDKAAFQPVSVQHVQVHGVIPLQVQKGRSLFFPLLYFMRFLCSP